MAPPDASRRPHFVTRYLGRATVVSLVIAAATGVAGQLGGPITITAALKLVFLATTATALLTGVFWLILRGCGAALARANTGDATETERDDAD